MKPINLISLVLFFSFASCAFITTDKKEEQSLPKPKNIIFFISDGMGYNHLLASNYYSFGEDKSQVFQSDDWVSLAMATYPSVVKRSDDSQTFSNGYNPKLASEDPTYLRSGATDSGAAGTALATGKKTYNGTIGISIYGDTLTHVTSAAKAQGKAIGVVSSVPLSHATPASFLAHNESRGNYDQIAQYMFFNTRADVIMAAGNPDFDNDGNPAEEDPRYVGGWEVWNLLKSNEALTIIETPEKSFQVKDVDGDGQPDPWTVIQTREEFQQMATGTTPKRVLGVPQVYSTLRQGRTEVESHNQPFQTPIKESIPTLEEMTKAAINVLSQDEDGFFVMVEGGAVDWASHSNNLPRMIEEQIDFNNAVKAAVEWVETNSNWDETLIIVTADHETGYLTGPGEPSPLYQPLKNNGKDNLPDAQWNSGGHTNSLVPFFAKGPGSELLPILARENDPLRGRFIQNTDMASLIFLMYGMPEK
jgi:alkaline phosphatase